MFVKIYCFSEEKVVYSKQTDVRENKNGGRTYEKDKEEYKSQIIELVNSIQDESILRRIYLILISMLGADH